LQESNREFIIFDLVVGDHFSPKTIKGKAGMEYRQLLFDFINGKPKPIKKEIVEPDIKL
jgi:hypothetical protein